MNKKQKKAIEDLEELWKIVANATYSQPGDTYQTALRCFERLNCHIKRGCQEPAEAIESAVKSTKENS